MNEESINEESILLYINGTKEKIVTRPPTNWCLSIDTELRSDENNKPKQRMNMPFDFQR